MCTCFPISLTPSLNHSPAPRHSGYYFLFLGLYFQQSCRPFLLICWGELSSFPKWAAFIILIPLPHLFCRALKTPRRQERSGNEIRGRKSRDGGRASERALRQEAFWFKAATLLSDVWKKAANLAKEWQLCMECVSVCVCVWSVWVYRLSIRLCLSVVGVLYVLDWAASATETHTSESPSCRQAISVQEKSTNAERLDRIMQVFCILVQESTVFSKNCPVNNSYTMWQCNRC